MSGIQKKQQNKRTQTKTSVKKDAQKTTQNVNLEQLVAAPETMRSEEILAAQQQVGNQVVQRALDGKKKREAMTDEQGYLKGKINDAIQKKRGGGSPLPESVRKDAGKRLGRDFEDVRIHTDEQASELSQSINARAFTIGKDIFFKKGVFSPASRAGRETLMHELTHVVQQSGSSSGNGRLKLGGPDTTHEKQADQVGKANSGADSVKSASNSKGTVQRLQGRLNALRGKKITKTEEEEKLQKQPDSAVQREEMPEEEELMMQEEEEMLQAQPDTGVVQRQDDDARKRQQLNAEIEAFNPRELKGAQQEANAAPPQDQAQDQEQDAPGRREQRREVRRERRGPALDDDVGVQRQPDTAGVVQRETTLQSEERRKRKEVFETMQKDGPLDNPQKKKLSSDLQTQQAKKRDLLGEIKGFDKRTLQDAQARKDADKEAEDKHATDTKYSKDNLLKTIKDPEASTEEVEKAEKMLRTMHKNKGFKGFFKKNAASGAMKERQKTLKGLAEQGQEGAFEKYQAEKKPSKAAKFGKGALGLAKGFFGSAAKDLKTQLFGEEKKEEAKEAAPASTGGGGAGLAGVLEEKIAENQRLKALLKENGIQAEKGA